MRPPSGIVQGHRTLQFVISSSVPEHPRIGAVTGGRSNLVPLIPPVLSYSERLPGSEAVCREHLLAEEAEVVGSGPTPRRVSSGRARRHLARVEAVAPQTPPAEVTV